ncbi:MAG: bifunctional 5,10-methylenetetrahydrofolate dehydrogenase/5,10-methenyltetrahydrofolate cyclohydrolase [Candidatus Paceibacterota bacterium]
MNRIDGKKIAADIVANLQKKTTPKKFLAAFCVGKNQSSVIFLKQKKRIADIIHIDFRLITLSQNIEESEVCREIKKIGEDSMCGGIIVQLPLPSHLDMRRVVNSIPPEKDIDVLSDAARARSAENKKAIYQPAVGTIDAILQNTHIEISKKKVAIVGMGTLVGKPIAAWLRGKCEELTCLDKGDDIRKVKRADVVILGTGVPHLIDGMMVNEGALVIDFGYGEKDGKVCGDFNPFPIENFYYTPTPGGTGPILVAQLFKNFYIVNS